MKNKLFKYVFLSIFLPIQAFAAQPSLTHVQIVNAGDYVRLIFKISAPVQAHVFTLANPDRIVVDLDGTHLRTSVRHLDLANSNISAARTGWPKPETLRVVFDLQTPAQVKNFMTSDNNEAELIVDVFPDKNSPPSKVAEVEPAAPVSKPVAPMVAAVTPIIKPVTKKQPKLQVVASSKPRQFVIVVDAGHGGKDPGTVGPNGTKEKDVVLGISMRLEELINQESNMHATMTRRGDYFVTLRDRLRLARKDKADLFIAIHADSYFNDQQTGASVYALSRHGASSMAARWLADRENHSELGGVDLNGLGDHSYVLRSVLIDLAQTATIIDSLRLGTDVLSSLGTVTPLHYSRVEQAPFMVLKSPDIPSILVETGFLSSPSEEERLREPAYREKVAHALLNGIRHYVASHPVMTGNDQSSDVTIKLPV